MTRIIKAQDWKETAEPFDGQLPFLHLLAQIIMDKGDMQEIVQGLNWEYTWENGIFMPQGEGEKKTVGAWEYK